MPKPRLVKRHGIKLTRSERRKRRAELDLLGVSGKGAWRKLAGLRRTDSGFLTREPKHVFVLHEPRSTRGKSEKQRAAEQYRGLKQQRKAAKKGARRGGKRGARPRREKKKGKK